MEGVGFVWAQRGSTSKKSGKKGGSDQSDNESDGEENGSMTSMRDLATFTSEEASRGRSSTGADPSREKLGLDRYIKRRRSSMLGRAADIMGEEEEEEEEVSSDGDNINSGKRSKRSKNYMTKGRTDAWMRKYDEFRRKNLRGDFSWKDNVQLRAWVRQQR